MKQKISIIVLLLISTLCNGQGYLVGTAPTSSPVIINKPPLPEHIQAIRNIRRASNPEQLCPGRHYVNIQHLASDPSAWQQRLDAFGVYIPCLYGYHHTPFANAPCVCIVERLEAQRIQAMRQAEAYAQQKRQQEHEAALRHYESEQKKLREEQEQKALQDKYDASSDCSIDELTNYAQGLEEEQTSYTDFPDKQERYAQRIKAIRALVHDKRIYTETKIIDSYLENKLNHHAIGINDWKTCTGNVFQQILHNEFIAMSAHLIHLQISADIEFYFLDMANIGRGFNSIGKVAQSMTFADWGWTFLECLAGAGKGVIAGVQNTAHMIYHPIDSIVNMVTGTSALIVRIACLSAKAELASHFISTNHPEKDRYWRDFVCDCDHIIDALNAAVKDKHAADYVEGAATFITEGYLQGKLVHCTSRFISQSKKSVVNFVKNLDAVMP